MLKVHEHTIFNRVLTHSLNACRVRIDSVGAINLLDHVNFRIESEGLLNILSSQRLKRLDLEVCGNHIIHEHVRLLRSVASALRRKESSHALKRCSLRAERLAAHIEFASIKFHALKIEGTNCLHIVEITIQQLNSFRGRTSSLASSNSCPLHEIKDCLPPDSITLCKLIEFECELILAQLLSGHASTHQGVGSIELNLLHLAINLIAEGQVVKGFRQPRNALCHHEGFRPLVKSEALRIKNYIDEAHLRIDFTLCTFENSSRCQTAQRPTNRTRNCSPKSNVPRKILDSVVIKDWRVIHRGNDSKFKCRAKHCLICSLPSKLAKAIARQDRLNGATPFSSFLQRLAEVFILA